MKNLLKAFIIAIVSLYPVQAQMNNYHLDFRAVVQSNDGVHKLILFNRGDVDGVIDGYILITRSNHNIEGRIQKNGFSFLDSKIFEVGIKSLRRKWVKNNFPVKDIETMTNGVDVEKVYSFEITPEILNIQSDSLSFYIKGAFYDLTKQNKNKECNLNYNIDLSYKLYKIPYNKTIPLDFLNRKLEDYNCSIKFIKIKKSEEYLSIENNQPLFYGIKKSVSESEFPPSARFKIGVEFIRANAESQYQSIVFSPFNFLLRVQQHALVPVNSLIDKQNSNRVELPVDVYHAELKFPFRLYNKEKSERYKNYKTKKKYFVLNIIL